MLTGPLSPIQRRVFVAACAHLAGSISGALLAGEPGAASLLAGAVGIALAEGWHKTRGRRVLTSVLPRWKPRRVRRNGDTMEKRTEQTMRTMERQAPTRKPANSNMERLIQAEIDLINKMLAAHGVNAGTKRQITVSVKSSFIAYGLQIAQGESVKKVERIQRELSNALTQQRARLLRGYAGRAVVRLRDYPLAIEVPHPAPTPLSWRPDVLDTPRFVGLVGRSYGHRGPQEEFVCLDQHYHTLVAAMSGGGKSTLMRMVLLTLARNTPSTDLRIMLVDLKNDDLTVFRSLPHVISFAGDIESAAEAIAQVHQIKTERIATQEKPYRLLLVIDELAELGADKTALKHLGSILSTGRSLGINVLAGTQYPTAATIGSVVNSSFTVRLVGMVDGMTAAHTATKRAGSGAHLLQTPGDFLRVDGQNLVRMKAYDISQEDTAVQVQKIVDDHKKKAKAFVFVPPDAPPRRDEIDALADMIHDLWIQDASKNAMAKYAFGKSYGGSYAIRIDAAIQRLIDRGSTTDS